MAQKPYHGPRFPGMCVNNRGGTVSSNSRFQMVLPVSVNKPFLLREPWPCNPEAETALQPLI